MITSIQLSSIVVLSLYWCTLPICVLYVRKLDASLLVDRQYKLTLWYLGTISLSCYLIYPISVILFYFANESKILTVSHVLNDISLFMVIYFALVRYVSLISTFQVERYKSQIHVCL